MAEKIAKQIINNTMKIYTPTYGNLDLARIVNKRMAEVCGCKSLCEAALNNATFHCKDNAAIVFDGKNLGWGSTRNYLRGSVYTLVTIDELMTMPVKEKAIEVSEDKFSAVVSKEGIRFCHGFSDTIYPHSLVTKLQEAIVKVYET